MMAYLAAKRMELSEGDYIAFAAEMPKYFQCSLRLEKELEKYKSEWKQHPDYLQLEERSLWRTGSEKQKYYEENDRLTQAFKAEYRSNVQE